jgi:LytS/YehU family sensor histidine kinase
MTSASAVRRACRSHWVRIGAVVVAVALVVTAVFAVAGSGPVLVTLRHALVHSATMGGLAALAVPRAMRRLRDVGAAARLAVLLPLLLGLAVVGTGVSCGILTVVDTAMHRTVGGCFASGLGINVLLTATVGGAMTLYETQRARLDDVTLALRTEELARERAGKMALEARLSALESRLHPHFLFNTLNAISALVHEDPERAERTVERLAALLRVALDATGRGVIPLAHEMKIVGDYLEIERTRLGERLSYAVEMAADVEDAAIPPLTVQTLVENSIKHAVAPRPGGGRLRVHAAARGDHVVVTVWDDGPGFTAAAIRPGHGLDNLQGRLAARFGPGARLEVAADDGGTRVTVTMPRTAAHRA